MIEALEAASFGFEVLLTTRSHQRVLVGQGLEGIRRVVRERRAWEMRAWIRAARRAKLIETKRVGDRIRVALAEEGRIRLLKERILAAPKLGDGSMTFVAFDFPVTQRAARDAFRRFLKTAGFRMLQQSLWSTRRDVTEPMLAFIRRSGAAKWVRILNGNEKGP